MPCTFTDCVFVLPIPPFSGKMHSMPRGAEVIAPRCFAMRRAQREECGEVQLNMEPTASRGSLKKMIVRPGN
jgi:hypothetical protein